MSDERTRALAALIEWHEVQQTFCIGNWHWAQAEFLRSLALESAVPVESRRYERLRILGCAPFGSTQLAKGTVLRFQGLDEFVDADLRWHQSRGETAPTATPADKEQS